MARLIIYRIVGETLSTISRVDLVEMIKANNMVEDLLEWLRSKKGMDTSEPISLNDLDINLLIEYARERGLIGEDVNVIEEEAKMLRDPEPEELKVDVRPTKPKKIRSKR